MLYINIQCGEHAVVILETWGLITLYIAILSVFHSNPAG